MFQTNHCRVEAALTGPQWKCPDCFRWPSGVEACGPRRRSRRSPVSGEPSWGWSSTNAAAFVSPSGFRRTLVGLKFDDLEADHLRLLFQTHPCGVEAPRGRDAANPCRGVPDEPLWGWSHRSPLQSFCLGAFQTHSRKVEAVENISKQKSRGSALHFA